jgi:hypothetical protein
MLNHSQRIHRKAAPRSRPQILFPVLAAASLPAMLAKGGATAWNAPTAGSGNWSDPGNWTAGVPQGGDAVYLIQSDAVDRVVTYDVAAGPGTSLAQFTINASGPGLMTLSVPSGSLAASQAFIANDGRALVNHQGGSISLGLGMYLGQSASGNGTYSLSSGSLSLMHPVSAQSVGECVGYAGSGTFNQSGGVNTIGGDGLFLGYYAGATGTYALSEGTLSVTWGYGFAEYVGYQGTGTFVQSGGSHTTTGLIIGQATGAHGSYLLADGTLSTTGESVGYNGTGSFMQSGGSHIVSGTNLFVGYLNTGNGAFELEGGTLLLTTGANEIVGHFGNGAFTQTGGAQTIQGYIQIGCSGSGTGNYTVSGGQASALKMYIGGTPFGAGGTGIVNLSGGTMNISGLLKVWDTPGSALNLSAGSLSVGSMDLSGNISRLHWTSGTLTISASDVYIASAAPTNATSLGPALSIEAGKSLNVIGNEIVGAGGVGTLEISGGSAMAGGIGVVSGGIVNLNGGSLATLSMVNHGALNLNGGSASVASLSGSGSTSIGDASGTATTPATLTVNSFAQGAIVVRSGGQLTVATNAAGVTNTVSALSILGSGKLDLGNSALLTATAAQTIKSLLASACSANQDWSGPGLTSSVAAANQINYTLAYADGSDQSAQDAAIPVAPGQVLVRPALVGDVNMDGKVDFLDISQVLGYKYNTGQPASYTDGDINFDGVVDFFDITTLLSANYNSGVVFPSAQPALAEAENVPEPLAPGFAAICGVALARRRRRRRRLCRCARVRFA